jgi:hypothetical protein
MWPARRGRPHYIVALALTRLAAWLAGHRRQPLQRAEDDACGEDDAQKTRRWGRRPRTLADRSGPHDPRECSGIFLAFSRAFLSSGVPERAPEGRGMAWACRMDEDPDPGENEDPAARLTDLRRPDKKTSAGSLVRRMSGDALRMLPHMFCQVRFDKFEAPNQTMYVLSSLLRAAPYHG